MASNRHGLIVIGAGPNGLACAHALAKAGRRPLVLERRSVLGGRAAMEEFHPGFRCYSVMEPGLDALPVLVPLPDGRALILNPQPERAAQAIAKFSTADAARYPDYHATMQRIGAAVAPVLDLAPPDIDKPGVAELWRLLKVGRGIRKLGDKDMFRLLRWGPMAAADLAAEWFEFEPLRAVLAARGIYGTAMGPWSAGSALVMLLQAAAAQKAASPAQALAEAAKAAGAEIRAGAEVVSIQMKDGRVTGVALKNGEEINAKAVVSAADPKRTLLGLTDAAQLAPDFATKVRNYRCFGTVARIHLALDALPTFTALKNLTTDAMDVAVEAWKEIEFKAGTPASAYEQALAGRIHIGPEIDYLERAFDASKYGEFSRKPFLEVTIPTLRDASLAPAGKHVMSIHAQYAPYKLRSGEWDAQREPLGDAVIKTLAEYAPDLPSKIVDGHLITPHDLEQTYGLTGGHIFHGELALDQLFTMRPVLGWGRYRTPISGLYLCGAGTHPGVGLGGQSGRNAARQIVKEVRK